MRGAQIPHVNTISDATAWVYYTAQGAGKLPATWKDTYAACGGTTMQSPINVVTASLSVDTTDPGNITLGAYDTDLMGDWKGDSLGLHYQSVSSIKPYIEGGSLTKNKKFVFSHLDFHFGSVDTQGSEHTIDAAKAPMEMHLVHFDNSLADETAASTSTATDAIVTIAFLFEIDSVDNAALAPMFAKIAATTGTTTTHDVPANLMKIVGMNLLEEYYYYDGSMTTPKCTENVKWIISPNKLKVSAAQLAILRALKTNKMQDNYRPVQAIGTRKVMHRKKPAVKKSEQVGQAATILGSTLLGITTFAGVYNLLTQDATAKALKSNPILDLIEDFDQKFLRGEDETAQHHHEHAQHEQQFQDQQFQQQQQFQQRYR